MDLAPSERLAQGPGDLFRPSLQGLPVMNPHGLIPDTAGDSRSRRAFLRAGAAGALGLTLGDGRAFSALARGPSPPARAVIMLWLWGGPSHLETFDMKPEAPAEYRGPFEPIATAVPGVQICELLPGLARRADKFALLRAVHHESNDHGIAGTIALTGSIAGAVGLGGAANTQAPRPSTGSIVGRSARREAGLAASLCDPRQSAPPGTEAGRRRGRRLAREHVRPLPPRLRAGHWSEAARCDPSGGRDCRPARCAVGAAPRARGLRSRQDRSLGPGEYEAVLRPGTRLDRLGPEPGRARRVAGAGAGPRELTGRTGSASAA